MSLTQSLALMSLTANPGAGPLAEPAHAANAYRFPAVIIASEATTAPVVLAVNEAAPEGSLRPLGRVDTQEVKLETEDASGRVEPLPEFATRERRSLIGVPKFLRRGKARTPLHPTLAEPRAMTGYYR